MKLVPAGVVLAVAVILGHTHEGVSDFTKVGIVLGYGTVIALLALAALDYRVRVRKQGSR